MIDNLALGFQVALGWENLLFCLLGVVLGTIVGLLPGIGPMAAMSLALPVLYTMPTPVTGIIFLAGIYYGSQYGGSTSSILLNLPGEASSVVTAIDGYQMTQNGRAGSALAIAALASFLAGTVSILIMSLVGPSLAEIAFLFGTAEYAMLLLLGMLACITMVDGSRLSALAMVTAGSLTGMIGVDSNTGVERMTLGQYWLLDGVSFVILAMGLFGLAEIIHFLLHGEKKKPNIPSIRDLWPTKKELARSWPAASRGTLIGNILGLLPGIGAVLTSFAAYSIEKKVSRYRKELGHGAPEGVAAPEAANNAGAQAGFIPMLSLGIPTTPVMALMISGLVINGIQPGSQVIENNPELFWGLIASMWIGNTILLILNLPLVAVWASILKIPRKLLFTTLVIICLIGAYYLQRNFYDIGLMLLFAVLGYAFKRLGCEPAPFAMGMIIGSLFEEYLRRSMSLTDGNWLGLIDRPGAMIIFLTIILMIIFSLLFKKTDTDIKKEIHSRNNQNL